MRWMAAVSVEAGTRPSEEDPDQRGTNDGPVHGQRKSPAGQKSRANRAIADLANGWETWQPAIVAAKSWPRKQVFIDTALAAFGNWLRSE